jgi:hypothetical protein
MPVIKEKVKDMKEAINTIDFYVFKLTNIFFITFKNIKVSDDKLKLIQDYIVQMSMLIPEIKAYLDLVELGVFDDMEQIVDKFNLIYDYVKATREYCKELSEEIGL